MASLRTVALWTKRYNGPGNSYDTAYSVAASPDGSKAFVTGSSIGSGGLTSDYATIAYDALTGQRLWIGRYNGTGDSYDSAYSIAVSPDGSRVFVTGGSAESGTFNDYATIAYDAVTGQRLWIRRYNGPGNSDDVALSVAASPDGSKAFVTGYSMGSGTFQDYATIAYDAVTGQRLWIRRYNGPGNSDDVALSVAGSPDGSKAFVTGTSNGSGTASDYATIAYDAPTGQRLWIGRYDGPGSSYDTPANSMAVSPDGSKAFVTGSSMGSEGLDSDYATIAYDAATGQRLWISRYNGLGHANDSAHSIAISADGSKTFVTGWSWGSVSYDYATIAYDATSGQPLWAQRHNGPGNGNDNASSIAVSPDGSKAFVTGFSIGAETGSDYATIAYDGTTGQPLWTQSYDGPGNSDDSAYSVAVSPDSSKAFVTGFSTGSGTLYDYATIAYLTE